VRFRRPADYDSVNQNQPALLVELYLKDGHISGLTDQVEQRRRLVDVLNGPDRFFSLDQAKLTLYASGGARFVQAMTVDKSAIILAVPHEIHEQLRLRAILNTGISAGRSTVQTQLGLVIPPLYVEGTAHLLPGAGKLRPDLASFSRFFALTSAQVTLQDGSNLELPVVLINRDGVAAVSLEPQPYLSRLAS
jgi:hypothetical protein